MASDIWLRTIYSTYQDSTYHNLCYTSRGALAGKRNKIVWRCLDTKKPNLKSQDESGFWPTWRPIYTIRGTHGSIRLQGAFGQLSSGRTQLAPVICKKHVTYSHLPDWVQLLRPVSGLKINAWAGNLVPAPLSVPSNWLLVCKHCLGRPTFKYHSLAIFKVCPMGYHCHCQELSDSKSGRYGRLLKLKMTWFEPIGPSSIFWYVINWINMQIAKMGLSLIVITCQCTGSALHTHISSISMY